MRILLLLCFFLLNSCAYQVGYKNKNLPGDYKTVQVPMFTNDTMYVGVETHFTNELKSQFYNTDTAEIRSDAPVIIQGHIRRIFIDQTRARADSEDFEDLLPANTVVTTSFNMTVDVLVKLIRVSDGKLLWQSEFTEFLPFSGAQLKLQGLNSSNTLYNQSAIKQNVKQMAGVMMSQVHSRMTENF